MKKKKSQIEFTGKIKYQTFIDVVFDELSVRNADIKESAFVRVHFRNSYLGFNSRYTDCTFENCKFYGKYTSLGYPAEYRNCKFLNCDFIGLDLFRGQHFYDCRFSGIMKNCILNDKNPIVENNETQFIRCDLSDLLFDNISIYGKDIFVDSKFPVKGVRLFDNTNDSLIKNAEEICSKINNEYKIESEIIFKRDLKSGQNPIILDSLFLDSFFKTIESRNIFDSIVMNYEQKICC
jgi:hypothetical protein